MNNIAYCSKTGEPCTLCKMGFLEDVTECPNRIRQSDVQHEDPTEGKYSGLITED